MGRPYRCTRTGVHDKGVLQTTYGHQANTLLEHGFEAQHWSQAKMSCKIISVSARSILALARSPEDRSKTFKHR
eukprot:8647785-Heterocapsa_arctica.AAC.1